MRITHAHHFEFASRARGLRRTALNPTLPMPLVIPMSVVMPMPVATLSVARSLTFRK